MGEMARRPVLPDPAGSWAVLIGTSASTSMEPLPAVGRNLTALRDLFTDTDLWGLPADRCTVLHNPGTAREVLDAIRAAATAATDTLLVYFAGHGLIDDRSELYLALTDTDPQRAYSGIRYDDVRHEVVGTATCGRKVVILDCCFSGRAMIGGMSGPADAVDHAAIEGTYLMAASAPTRKALAPVGERYTAFTGALVELLTDGLPDGPDLLDLDTLFLHLRNRLRTRDRPIPQQRAGNDGRLIAIGRNRRGQAYGGKVTPIERVLPDAPPGLRSLRPREIVERLGKLGAEERAALLAGAGARHREQAVAGLVELLADAADRRAVLAAATRRVPAEVREILGALRETDQPAAALVLLECASHRPVAEIAALAHALGSPTDVTALLAFALGQADRRDVVVDLVNALWLAGLRDEVDILLRAVGSLAEADAVALADDLRGAGREQAAFGLYFAAVETVAARPVTEVAELIAAAEKAGLSDGADRIAAAVIASCDGPVGFLAAFRAFRGTRQTHAVRDAAAERLPTAGVIAVVDALLSEEMDAEALDLCTAALRHGSFAGALELADAVRDAGRPVDAKRLLETAAERLPAAEAARLLDRRAHLVAGAARRPAAEVAAITTALLARHDTETAGKLVERASTGDPVELIAAAELHRHRQFTAMVAAALLSGRHPADIAGLLTTLPPASARTLLLWLLRSDRRAWQVIQELRTGVAGRGEPVLALMEGLPLDRAGELLVQLRRNELDDCADVYVSEAVGRVGSVDEFAAAFGALRADGAHRDADHLLRRGLGGKSVPDQRDLIIALDRAGHAAEVPLLTAAIREAATRVAVSNLAGLLRRAGYPQYADLLV